MVMIDSFRKIIAWQKAHQLVLKAHSLIKGFPKSEEFALSNQIRRCSVSIPSNIAEGFKRRSVKDRIHFYNIAEASLEELKYQLFLSKELCYITSEQLGEFEELADETGRLINGWIKSQNSNEPC